MPNTNTTTVVGNLVRDVELKFTTTGTAIASFGLAVNRSWKNKQDEWVEQTSFFDITAFGEMGENVAASLTKGARVIVSGRLEQQSWENQEGEKRSKIAIIADAVGPDLKYATAEVARTERTSSSSGGGYSTGGQGDTSPLPDEEPFVMPAT